MTGKTYLASHPPELQSTSSPPGDKTVENLAGLNSSSNLVSTERETKKRVLSRNMSELGQEHVFEIETQ